MAGGILAGCRSCGPWPPLKPSLGLKPSLPITLLIAVNTSYIRHAIKRHFHSSEVDEVFSLLRHYDELPRPDFTYYAILRYARGDKELVRKAVDWARVNKQGFLLVAERNATWHYLIDALAQKAKAGDIEAMTLLPISVAMVASGWSDRCYGRGPSGCVAITMEKEGFRPRAMILAPTGYPTNRAVQISYYDDMALPGSYVGAGRDVTATIHWPGATNIETVQCSVQESFDNIAMHLARYSVRNLVAGPL